MRKFFAPFVVLMALMLSVLNPLSAFAQEATPITGLMECVGGPLDGQNVQTAAECAPVPPVKVYVCSDSRQVSDPALCVTTQTAAPATQPVEVAPAPAQVSAPVTEAAMPQTMEEARALMGVSPEVQINSIDNGWFFTTLPVGGTEFTLSLPAGACVDFDPFYQKTGSKHMLDEAAYGTPAIDTDRRMLAFIVTPAILEHISVATVRWNVPCGQPTSAPIVGAEAQQVQAPAIVGDAASAVANTVVNIPAALNSACLSNPSALSALLVQDADLLTGIWTAYPDGGFQYAGNEATMTVPQGIIINDETNTHRTAGVPVTSSNFTLYCV